MRGRLAQFLFLLTMCTTALATHAALAELRLERKQLGWDNSLRAEAFNQLAFVVRNYGDSAWQGNVTLRNREGETFAMVERDLFIEPGGSRVLNFTVYYRASADYVLEWADAGRFSQTSLLDELQVELPTSSEPAVIQLVDTNGDGNGSWAPVFETQFFPSSIAGATGLKAIVLDEVPKLQPAQQRALLDWVYQGGDLHLFGDSASDRLEFPAVLGELNQPFDRFEVGSGRVIRHRESARSANKKFVETQILNLPDADTEVAYDDYVSPPVGAIFRPLKEITRPEHNWTVIYLLAMLYLLLIFPGGYLLGRFKGDYRVTYGAIIAVVLLFSLAFDFVGRRGYGEVTSCNYVALARPVGGDRLQVTQFSNLFVTAGGTYQVVHPAKDCAYAHSQGTSVGRRDVTFNRPLSELFVDIPAFSDRPITHVGEVEGRISPLRVERVIQSADGPPQALQVKPVDAAAWPAEVVEMRIVAGSQTRLLTSDGSDGYALTGNWEGLREFYEANSYSEYGYQYQYSKQDAASRFRSTFAPAMMVDLGLDNGQDFRKFQLPPDRVRIYIMAPGTDAFRVEGDLTPQQAGRVIYVQELTLSPEREETVIEAENVDANANANESTTESN